MQATKSRSNEPLAFTEPPCLPCYRLWLLAIFLRFPCPAWPARPCASLFESERHSLLTTCPFASAPGTRLVKNAQMQGKEKKGTAPFFRKYKKGAVPFFSVRRSDRGRSVMRCLTGAVIASSRKGAWQTHQFFPLYVIATSLPLLAMTSR
jgi:hypothetical protein